MKSVIYWTRRVGLANRLRALVGYQAMANVLDIPFYLCWEADWECDAYFADLFQPEDIALIAPEQKQEMLKQGDAALCQEHQWYDRTWETYLKDRVSWKEYRAQAMTCINKLKPASRIIKKIDTFHNAHDIAGGLALHVRMTDNLRAYRSLSEKVFKPERISKLEGFDIILKDTLKKNPSSKVLLATDNKSVEELFVRSYPDNVVTYSKQYRKGRIKRQFSLRRLGFAKRVQRTTLPEDALVEMILLSKYSSIVGTYFSSFGEFSAVMGDCSYYVVHGTRCVKSRFIEKLTGRDE